jgi:putative nucleotidyltransferase with HDIG domain
MVAPFSRYHVAAGAFHISEQRALILQAYLGTCVGVALHCETSRVGGIIHILLPEPINAETCDQPEKYASTGLPLFIQGLLAAGARRESLSASLAGGALVGPLRQQDLDLDIGGRTVETAKKVLAEQNIRIVQSETGGFFTCCLNLDLSTGEVSIEPAGQSKLSAKADMPAPDPTAIKTAMQRLKPIPQVALKILRLVDQNKYDVDAIAREIRKDQVITARMLQLANSAMFGTRMAITSLDHAVVFLGQDLLVKIILSAALQGYFEQSTMGYALCKGGIYHHAIGCAHMAETLARRTQREEPAKAYTAGLLHDIGKVVLDQFITNAYPLFYREIMAAKDDILAIEQRLLGLNHTQVGSLLAHDWSLPPALAQVVLHHHRPDDAREYGDLCTIVYLADLLMSRFRTGLEIERLAAPDLPRHLARLGLTPGDLIDIVDSMPPFIFKSSERS